MSTTHVVTLPMDGCECFRCQQLRLAQLTPTKAFEAEAVQTAQRTVERFQQRLVDEQAMADTVSVHSDNEVRELNRMIDTLEGQNERLTKDNAVLIARIEELELARQSEIDLKGKRDGVIDNDLLMRIAYVLRTFYYAPLSISAVQPIIALAMELNPEIVEQKR
jgi:leucyl-tRNA synthetase